MSININPKAALPAEPQITEEEFAQMVHDAPAEKCSCGGTIFRKGFNIKIVESFRLPQSMIVTPQIVYCAKCQTPYTPPVKTAPSIIKS